MVLAKDVDCLWRLVREAKDDRKPFDDGFAKIEDMFVSRWYGRGGRKKAKSQPENVPFSFAAMMLPHMIQASPRFLAKADGTYHNEVFAAGSQAALNLIARRGAWHRVLRPGAFDYLMSYPAFFVEMAPARHASVPDAMRSRLKGALRKVAGAERDSPVFQASPMSPAPPHWPALRHVQRDRWGWDMKARVLDEARFLWWETTYSIDQLKDISKREPKKWNAGAIAKLVAAHGAQELGYAGSRFGGGSESVEDRDEVCVHQVWVPEDELDAPPGRGEKGVVYTIVAQNTDGRDFPIEIAPPYYFYGPPSGPLVTGGQYTVSMESVPVNMLMANKEQIDLVNAVAWSVGKRIKDHKRVYAYDMAIDGDVRAMAMRADGQFQGIAGMMRDGQPLIMPVDMGGVDRADIAHYQVALDSMSRNVIGSDEAIRGQVGSGSTATEVSAAFNQTFSKIEFILQGWEQIVVDCGHAVRWYVENDTRFFTFMDQEGKELIRRRQAQQLIDQGIMSEEEVGVALKRSKSRPYPFQGGDLALDESGQIDPHAVEVELEAFSMQRRTSASRRADEVALNQQLVMLNDAALRYPAFGWKQRFKSLGESWGAVGIEELFDEEKASEIAGIQIAAGLPEARFEGFGSESRGASQTDPMPKSARPVSGARPGRAKVAAEAAPERT